jgi:hypothetical protein
MEGASLILLLLSGVFLLFFCFFFFFFFLVKKIRINYQNLYLLPVIYILISLIEERTPLLCMVTGPVYPLRMGTVLMD